MATNKLTKTVSRALLTCSLALTGFAMAPAAVYPAPAQAFVTAPAQAFGTPSLPMGCCYCGCEGGGRGSGGFNPSDDNGSHLGEIKNGGGGLPGDSGVHKGDPN